MTDRIKGLIVVLETSLRDDDADGIMSAIGQLRGVREVRQAKELSGDIIARAQARGEIAVLLQKVLDEYV
jgi:hypothetical protein